MQVEHITLGGNSSIRDTNGIYPETINLLKEFQISRGKKSIPFPKTSFSVNITATEEGAIFDVVRSCNIAIVNICYFSYDYTNELFEHVQNMYNTICMGKPRLPVLENWIYSIMINPFALSPEEISTAGEVELYIYYALYLARKK